MIRGLSGILLVILVSSFTITTPAKRFTPVGTWDLTLVGVPYEYESIVMKINKEGKEYIVNMGTNDYDMTTTENVVYKKKNLTFTVIAGEYSIDFKIMFDKDTCKGTISLSEGVFDMTGERRAP
jgi:hypothetical protein